MRIFNWVSYGTISSYVANDTEDLKFIFMSMYNCLRDLGIEEYYPESDIPLSRFTERDVYNLSMKYHFSVIIFIKVDN